MNSLNIDIDVNCGEWMFPLLGVTGGEVLLFNVEEEEILEFLIDKGEILGQRL